MRTSRRNPLAKYDQDDGEEVFAFYWRVLAPGFPKPQRDAPVVDGRNWTVDFLFPGNVVVEIEGVSHRLSRYETDIEKYDRLALEGYLLLRITRKLLTNNPAAFINQVKAAILKRKDSSQ